MGIPVTVRHFPSFAAASDVEFTRCIHPIQSEGQRLCKVKIDRTDLSKIEASLEAIAYAVGSTYLPDVLEEYIILRCCGRFHNRPSHLKTQLAQNWANELNADEEDVPETRRSAHEQAFCHQSETARLGRAYRLAPQEPTHSLAHRRAEPQAALAHHSTTRLGTKYQPAYSEPTHLATPGNSTSATSPRARDVTGFTPYVRNPKYTVEAKLREPLTNTAWKTGTLYLFSRPSSPGFVKIGYTTVALSARMRQWEKSCNYTPVVQHAIHDVPHVFRVEQLVHTELKEYWRRETRCKHNASCPTQHQEWFEVSVEKAKRVMKRWAEWVVQARPYTKSGRLMHEWSQVASWTMSQGKSVTAKTLIEAFAPRSQEHRSIERINKPARETIPEQRIQVARNAPIQRMVSNASDLNEITRLLEKFSRELYATSYQRRLRTHTSVDFSPATGQNPWTLATTTYVTASA